MGGGLVSKRGEPLVSALPDGGMGSRDGVLLLLRSVSEFFIYYSTYKYSTVSHTINWCKAGVTCHIQSQSWDLAELRFPYRGDSGRVCDMLFPFCASLCLVVLWVHSY